MSGPRLTDAALACYPPWWRALYGEEVGQLTHDLRAEGRGELRLAMDLARGAVSARIWARAMPLRADLWHARSQASIAVAALPFIAALPLVFFGLQGDEGFRTLPRAEVLALSQRHGAQVGRSMAMLLHNGLVVGLIAALVGWLALFDGVRWGRVPRPSHPRLLVRLPLAFLVALIGLYVARIVVMPRGVEMLPNSHVIITTGGHPAVAAALLGALWAVLAVGAAITLISIARLVTVCELPWRTMVSGRRVAAVTAFLLSAMAACAVTGEVASGAQGFVTRTMGVAPGNPHTPFTAYLVFPHWGLMAVPLVLASVASFAGWRASRRAERVLRRLDPGAGLLGHRF